MTPPDSRVLRSSQPGLVGAIPLGLRGPVQRWFDATVIPDPNHQHKHFDSDNLSLLSNESRRDSETKPKVARNELPWVPFARIHQLRRSCGLWLSEWAQPHSRLMGFFMTGS